MAWYRLLYDYTVPKFLTTTGEYPLNTDHVPCIYPTDKSKRWDGGLRVPKHGRHRRVNPKRSCSRNMCSFVRLFPRALYCFICRAFMITFNQMVPGWPFMLLDRAIPNMFDQYAHLVTLPSSVPCVFAEGVGCKCLARAWWLGMLVRRARPLMWERSTPAWKAFSRSLILVKKNMSGDASLSCARVVRMCSSGEARRNVCGIARPGMPAVFGGPCTVSWA